MNTKFKIYDETPEQFVGGNFITMNEARRITGRCHALISSDIAKGRIGGFKIKRGALVYGVWQLERKEVEWYYKNRPDFRKVGRIKSEKIMSTSTELVELMTAIREAQPMTIVDADIKSKPNISILRLAIVIMAMAAVSILTYVYRDEVVSEVSKFSEFVMTVEDKYVTSIIAL